MDAGKVLLIEYNTEDIVVISELLKKNGYQVQCINNSREGLSRIHEERFDLVILGLPLSDITGKELCLQIKKKIRKKVPVIVLSLKDDISDIEDIFNNGADECIIKPFRNECLLEKVKSTIAKDR